MKFKLGFALAAIVTIAAAPVASAHDNGYHHSHQSHSGGNQQLAGGAIGAVIGGVLGSQVAANGARTEGSVLGAVLGGVAGAAIAGNGSNGRRHYGGNSYNSHSGYGGYNSGYYNTGYGHSYPRTYTTTTYSQPYYSGYSYPSTYYGGGSYYSRPRTSLSINIGSGGYYGGRRGYYSSPYYSRPRVRRIRNRHARRFRH
jgi:hypothetical protein